MSIRKSQVVFPIDASLSFESRVEQMEHVRSVLWAMKCLLGSDSAGLVSARTTHFELRLLATVGVRLADDLIDDMRMEEMEPKR